MKAIKNLKTIILLTILTPFLFNCTSNKRSVSDLPIIGNHDVVNEAFDGYQVGDTIYHSIPEWSYINQDSLWINSEDIKGKVWIVDFIFTHCPTVCSPMTDKMNDVNKELAEWKDKLTFISFSIDPKRDSVARLREFMGEHNIVADNWEFLTGNQEETNQLAFDGFQIFATEDHRAPGGFAHSPNFVLVDKNLHIRGVYDGMNDEQREQLIEDAKLLLNADAY